MTSASNAGQVLVLDAELDAALSVARSLSGLGLRVHVGASSPSPIAAHSRHVRHAMVYPDPMTDPGGFLDWLVDVTLTGEYQLVIPVSERSLLPIASHRERMQHQIVAMAPAESLDVALDKERTLALASSLGVPVPRSATVSEVGELGEAVNGLEYPVVLKPGRSMGGLTDRRVALQVDYANNESELRGRTRPLLEHGTLILQEFFRGDGVGIELIADRGEIVYAFQHLRLHEVPLSGGGSTLRKSVPVDAALLEASRALMRALKWHGVAMVEFKQSRETGEFRLMEINGRLWGSLPLAVAAGADFPAMLYRLHVQGTVGETTPARIGVYCRKLALDLHWLELVARHGEAESVARIPSLASGLRDLATMFSPKHYFDVQQLMDPVPGLVDLHRILRTNIRRLHSLLADRFLLARQARAWSRAEVMDRMQAADCILFVCYGNINRSILAERYMQQLVPDLAERVCSAGFHDQDGRPADLTMIEVASRHGVNLSGTSSTRLSQELLRAADIIFVMDLQQLRRVAAMEPAAARRTYLLGMACASRMEGAEIADPYGRSADVYERCFVEVTRSVRRVSQAMSTARVAPGDSGS